MTSIAQAAELDRVAIAARRRATLTSAVLVSVAMGASGVLTYAFQIVAARTLDSSAFGEIAILWGGVFLVSIVAFRPLEQTLSRWVAERIVERSSPAPILRSVAVIAAGTVAGLSVLFVGFWGAITHHLFHGDAFMTAMFAAGVAGYGLSYVVRGLVGGVRWFGGYASVLVSDSVIRLSVVLPTVLYPSLHLAAIAVAAAGVGGAIAPFFRPRSWLPALRGGSPGMPFDRRSAFRFSGPATVIAASDQLMVNGGPLLVIVIGHGGAKAAGVVFAATMLMRAPVYVFTGVAASLLPNFTLLGATSREGLHDVLQRTQRILFATGTAIVLAAGLVAPLVLRSLYGASFDITRSELVILGVGISLYLAAATFLQALLALERACAAAVVWVLGGFVLVAAYAGAGGGEVMRISIATTAGTAVTSIGQWALLRRELARKGR
jgi:O-antigen/teichoic acid export membrane protein